MKKLIFASAAGILLLFSASSSNASYENVELTSDYLGKNCKVYNDQGVVVASCYRCNCAKLYKTVKSLE